jgi:hypothetical protein
MLKVLSHANTGQSTAAYQYLQQRENRARELGPTYASKISYFVTKGEESPILDSEVAMWIWKHEGAWLFDPARWSTERYSAFHEYCRCLLEVLADVVPSCPLTLGFVEYLMFVDRAAQSVPEWARTI